MCIGDINDSIFLEMLIKNPTHELSGFFVPGRIYEVVL